MHTPPVTSISYVLPHCMRMKISYSLLLILHLHEYSYTICRLQINNCPYTVKNHRMLTRNKTYIVIVIPCFLSKNIYFIVCCNYGSKPEYPNFFWETAHYYIAQGILKHNMCSPEANIIWFLFSKRRRYVTQPLTPANGSIWNRFLIIQQNLLYIL